MQQTLSAIIEDVFDVQKGPSTYGHVIDEIDQHGMAVILILFALPSALPVPAAGYSTVLSIPLFIIGFRLLCGYNTLWMPASWRGKPFRPEQFSRKVINRMLQLIQYVERLTKPRLVSFARSRWIRVVLGILIIALACSMLLPIPGTNTAPAFGIFLIGFALLEDDGVMLLVGMAASLVALAISIAIILFGYAVVKGVISSLF
ncbi:exopolysaccharide biosynthesis protein [Candidatus Entotheonella palauensis]|uniref:exopolysaccharide biosynthesis protein n=1 Tax=Candidatus Entotheonella palauensis TaxID=93172 RepID=UPI0004AE1BCE|nr:exopolysaccharide biosynthesis protein [Candidatus Entotheonella palauensis]